MVGGGAPGSKKGLMGLDVILGQKFKWEMGGQ